jgi:ABC-type nitrate/sulfonate/bicarbonate transport system permease component
MRPQPPGYLRPFSEYLLLPSYWRTLIWRSAGGLVLVVALDLWLQSSLARNGLVLTVGWTFSLLLFAISRGFRARGALSWLKNDRRRPILYLRSFSKDEGISSFLGGHTPEQSLAMAVLPLGPLVAIGQPGETLPPAGAARLHVVDHDHWKTVVENLASVSQFVVLRIGQSEGFWWELKHLFATCEPEKVLIFLPANEPTKDYLTFCTRAKDILPVGLPLETGRACFLAFGAGWQPFLVGWPKGRLQAICRAIFLRPDRVLADALASLKTVRSAAASSIAPPQSRFLPWLSVLAGLFLWELVGELYALAFSSMNIIEQSELTFGLAPIFDPLPIPMIIAPKMVQLATSGAFWHALSISALEFLTGYAIAATLGIAIGYVMSESGTANRILRPWSFWLYAMPAAALQFVLAGAEFRFVVCVVVALVLFPLILNTADALPTPLERMRGVSRTSRLPMILKGLKLGIERGLTGVLLGEQATRGGIVDEMQFAFLRNDMAAIYAMVVAFSFLGISLIGAATWLEKRPAFFTSRRSVRNGEETSKAWAVFLKPSQVLTDEPASLETVQRPAAASSIAQPKSRFLPLLSVLAGLLLWELVGELFGFASSPMHSVPTPMIIAPKMVQLATSGAFWHALGISALEFLTGYAIAATLGIAIGYRMSVSSSASRILRPWIFWFYAMPAAALCGWPVENAGYGFSFVVCVVVALVLFPLILNTADAFPTPLERMRGVSRISRLPMILKGLKLGIERGLTGVVLGEGVAFLNGGIVYEMTRTVEHNDDMPAVYAMVVAFSFLGISLVGAATWLEKRLVFFTSRRSARNDEETSKALLNDA